MPIEGTLLAGGCHALQEITADFDTDNASDVAVGTYLSATTSADTRDGTGIDFNKPATSQQESRKIVTQGGDRFSYGQTICVPSAASFPSGAIDFMGMAASGLSNSGSVALDNNGKLRIWDAVGISIYTFTNALTKGTKYWVVFEGQYDGLMPSSHSEFRVLLYTSPDSDTTLGTLIEDSGWISGFGTGGWVAPYIGNALLSSNSIRIILSNWIVVYTQSFNASDGSNRWVIEVPRNVRAKRIVPTGNSATDNAFTASAGNKWDCVDDYPVAAAPGDYIHITSTGVQTFTYAGLSIPAADTIVAVAVQGNAYQQGATLSVAGTRFRDNRGGIGYASRGFTANATVYELMPTLLMSENPRTAPTMAGLDFTPAQVDACEIGVRKSLGASSWRVGNVAGFVLYSPELIAGRAEFAPVLNRNYPDFIYGSPSMISQGMMGAGRQSGDL